MFCLLGEAGVVAAFAGAAWSFSWAGNDGTQGRNRKIAAAALLLLILALLRNLHRSFCTPYVRLLLSTGSSGHPDVIGRSNIGVGRGGGYAHALERILLLRHRSKDE